MLFIPWPDLLNIATYFDDFWGWLPEWHWLHYYPHWRERVLISWLKPADSIVINGYAYWRYHAGDSGSYLPDGGRPHWVEFPDGSREAVLLWGNGYVPCWARPYLPDNAVHYHPTKEELYAYRVPAAAALPR